MLLQHCCHLPLSIAVIARTWRAWAALGLQQLFFTTALPQSAGAEMAQLAANTGETDCDG